MTIPTGCGAGDQRSTVSEKSSAIWNGTVIDTAPYRAIVHLRSAWSQCTATFISQNLAIAAAHCFSCAPWMGPEAPCWCHPDHPAECAPGAAPAGTGRDGWTLAFLDTNPDPNPAADRRWRLFAGVNAAGPQSWDVDYVWFPKKHVNPEHTSILDVAIMHTVQRLDAQLPGVQPIPLRQRDEMPTPASVDTPLAQGGDQGLAVEMVGFSNNSLGGGPQRRRGTGTIESSSTSRPWSQFRVSSENNATCGGDSGGPLLEVVNNTLHVVGVMSESYPCGPNLDPRGGIYAYIEYDFLDDLCKGAPFEGCNWNPPALANDPNGDIDHDGIPNGIDNCPTIANADQKNCDAEGEADNGLPARGDACDPNPCPTVGASFGAIQLAQEGGTTTPTSFPFLHWELISGGPAKISMRSSILDTPNIGTTFQPGVHPRYCACQDPANGDPYDETYCKLFACPSHGQNNINFSRDRDVGYQTLIWKKALRLGDCAPADPDGNGQENECATTLTYRTFRRLFRHRGTPLCTDRSENGCATGDNDAFWRRDSNTETFVWDWLQQDYPHLTGIYDPATTQQALVRVWLHADSTPTDTHGNSYSEPTWLYRGVSKLVVSKPIYDIGLRHAWWMASTIEPWGPISVLTPIPRSVDVSEVPDGWAWLDENDHSATRALIGTPFDPAGGAMSGSQPGTFVGDPDQGLTTIGFAAARFGEATFAFGGLDGDQRLGTGLWYGISEGDQQYWQPVDGALQLAAATASAPTTSKTSGQNKKAKPATMPTGKSYQSWRSALIAKSPVSRQSLALLAAQKQATFTATMLARQAAKSQTTKSQAVSTLGTISAPMVTLSFGSGTPQPQKEGVLLGDAQQNTLVALFGELERPRGEGEAVPVAVFDLQAGEWIVGEVDWSCGPRYAVAYAGTDYDTALQSRSILFYGGKLEDAVMDGLYIQTLHPELLFSGQDVTRLDADAATSPGARAYAVMTYDPDSRLIYLFGGVDGDGSTRNDLWVFSRNEGRWTRLSDGSDPSAPPAQLAAGLAQSPIDGSLVVVAGNPTEGQASTWRWVNASWQVERQTEGG